MSLPNDYLPLEYIESTGTQWIETGLYAYALDIITIVGEFTELKNCYILGCHNSGRYRKIGIRMVDDVPKFIASCGYWNEDVPGGIAHMGLIVTDATLGKHTFIYNYARNSLTVDGTEYALYNGLNDPSTDREAPGVNVERHNTMVLFGYRHDSEFDIPGRANFKLYECTIQQNGEVARNYVPVARLTDKEIGLYDTINNTFTTSSDTTGGNFNFELNSYKTIVNAPRLPGGYTELDYIQSSGTQYINTDITPSNNTNVKTKIELTSTSQDIPVFGCLSNGTASNPRYYHVTPFLNKWYYGLNNLESNAGTYINTIGTQYEINFNNNSHQLIVNGTTLATFTTYPIGNGNLAIARRSGSSVKYGLYKYFYFKIYNGSTLVRDFVPAKNSSNVLGMYDLVSNTFFTNAGTGTFTAGPIASIEKLSYKTIVNNNINYNSKVYL